MNQADTAWMLISAALVLLMTPALAFFYGGLVRSKNALNTMMMSVVALGFVGVEKALCRTFGRRRLIELSFRLLCHIGNLIFKEPPKNRGGFGCRRCQPRTAPDYQNEILCQTL